MKKILIIIMASLFSFAQHTAAQNNDPKILIAYYSLFDGNTRIVAEQIQRQVGGQIFRIEPTHTYPADYRGVTDQAQKELRTGFRPTLKSTVVDFGQYDLIFIGSPNWWGTVTTSVMSFLESYDFKGKTVVPFITHEGSAMGNSEADIRRLVPQARVLKGLPVRGGSVSKAEPAVREWLISLGIRR